MFKFNQNSNIQGYNKAVNKLGLPLKIFNSKTLLLPAASIRDLKRLEKLDGYLIGTTNSFFLQNPTLKADLNINLDKQTFDIKDKVLKQVVSSHSLYEIEIIEKVIFLHSNIF